MKGCDRALDPITMGYKEGAGQQRGGVNRWKLKEELLTLNNRAVGGNV